ncbi:MAG: hypothetical protein A2267_02630 [Omnitrophica WOR_2 bacterium RIFOXYA12_FULL_38_10]|nr:MAG: hypothetical protein A2267_02630 [Omnitrophica WOR_2 bacterium RIFOXYA12_FULL_38_10]OGX55976.1 MAG: hypothetical protein A2447_00820 [Omnitrophica WOR_2 bacterium RIFOXYC2_FULL_38_12]
MGQDRKVLRYSNAFKQKVVSEIESGEISIWQAQNIYDIRGSATIAKWIRKLGKNHLLAKVVRIEMRDEKDNMKEMKSRERELEKALAGAQLKIMALESTIEVMEEEYGMKVKKNYGGVELDGVLKKRNALKRK